MKIIMLLFNFILDLYRNRRMLWELTKKDFHKRYLGNYLGILWAFIQPAITVLIFWFVFQVGFKSMPVADCPFILWLLCGMFPWFFFSESISSASGSILENSYLVKKVVFKINLLPMVQIFSAFIVHAFFIGVLFFMFLIYGYPPSVYNLQIIYYDLAMICFVFGISLITSTLIIFLKDIGQIVAMCLQFGFWGTPIFWNLSMIPSKYQFIFKMNPMYYIVNGYRNAFIDHIWFWQLGYVNLSFWIMTIFVMFLGVYLFKKLRPHFADIL